MALPSPNADPAPTVHRVAGLQLRGGAGPIPCRVYWPAPAPGPPPLLVFFAAPGPDGGGDAWGRGLCAGAGAVVLSAPGHLAAHDAVAVVEWAADRGDELGADPERLLVGGQGPGAGLAASVAACARDAGWPPLVRQLLVAPDASAGESPAPADVGAGPAVEALGAVAGLAPATVLTAGDAPGGEALRRYATRLAAAGVEVEELHGAGPAPLAEALCRALRSQGGPA